MGSFWFRLRLVFAVLTIAVLVGGADLRSTQVAAVSDFDRYANDSLADRYPWTPMTRGWRLTHSGWGDTDLDALALVLSETAEVLLEDVHEGKLSRTHVAVFSWDLLPPNENYGGRSYTSGRVFNVYLKPYGNDWRRYVSVYAHELCHVLDANSRTPSRYRWFEETLCQVASLHALEKLADRWDESHDLWRKRYAPLLRDYQEFLLTRKDTELPAGMTLASWYHRAGNGLDRRWEDYAKNDIIARRLFPYFREYDGAWEALTYLKSAGNAESLAAYLDRWHRAVPTRHRQFVSVVAREFGFRVTDAPKTVSVF